MRILLLFLISILFSCSARLEQPGANKNPGDAHTKHRVYISEKGDQGIVVKRRELRLLVKGSLPSPAYSFEKFNVKIEDNLVIITPIASYKPGNFVAQMLVPFQQVCVVPDLKAGRYKIQVLGRGEAMVDYGSFWIK